MSAVTLVHRRALLLASLACCAAAAGKAQAASLSEQDLISASSHGSGAAGGLSETPPEATEQAQEQVAPAVISSGGSGGGFGAPPPESAPGGSTPPAEAPQAPQGEVPSANSAEGALIENVTVSGNKRVETATILSYLGMKAGDAYTEEKANVALKKLFQLGLFANIGVNYAPQTRELRVTVDENPSVDKIFFEGNKHLEDDALTPEMSLTPRSVYSRQSLQRDTERILQLYRKSGRYSVSVEPKIIRMDGNRVNVVYEIDEGDKAKISKIYFTGNEIFSTSALKDVISSGEQRWYRFFSSADNYDEDRMQFDKELLRRFYLNQGYIDFKILSANAELSEDKRRFTLTYALEEGGRYRFGDVGVKSSISSVNTDELKKLIQTKENTFFDDRQVNDTVDAITKALNNKGYAFVEVRPNLRPDPSTRRAGLTYEVREGDKVYINNINIAGNVRTLDKVIRREMRTAEGDPYNAENLKRSEQRIKNLGFFNKVEIKTAKAGASDRADLNVEVEERSTGELNFGAGFSTADGPLGNVSIRERNFLGKGQDVNLSFQRSSRGAEANIGFIEPYLFDRDLEAGFNVFSNNYQYEESSFNSESRGANAHIAYPLTEFLRHSIYYTLKDLNITDVRADASEYIRRQQGRRVTSLAGQSFTYDKRDSAILPTEGVYAKLSTDVAGLGGDAKYFKGEFKGRYYYPVYKRKVVLMLGGNAGHMIGFGGSTPRINERFFVGNNIIRGFDVAGIGPRDQKTNDSLGGNTYYAGTAELGFPLGLPEELGVRGAAFVDAGTLYNADEEAIAGSKILDESSLRAAAGIGLSWNSPLGPIRIDVAAPFMKKNYDTVQNFRFNFGTRF